MTTPNYRQMIERMLDDQVNKNYVGEDKHLLVLRQRGYLTGLLARLMQENYSVKREVRARINPDSDTAPIVNRSDW